MALPGWGISFNFHFTHLFQPGEGDCVLPPFSDWFDLAEWYIFKAFLLGSFLWALYEIAKRKIKQR